MNNSRSSSHGQQERCCFVVVSAPILTQLQCAFQPLARPTDPVCYAVAFALKISITLNIWKSLMNVDILTRILYFLLGLSIVSIAFRAGFQERRDLVDLIIVRQTVIVLVMATVLCSNLLLRIVLVYYSQLISVTPLDIVYAIANGRLMALFDLLQERSAKGDFTNVNLDANFDAEDQLRVVSSVPRGESLVVVDCSVRSLTITFL